jgi:hypothetical protein
LIDLIVRGFIRAAFLKAFAQAPFNFVGLSEAAARVTVEMR